MRVAVVGAGPAGAYAAGLLMSSVRRVEVDLFERLPTPWGLVRGGVAPDHQEIKQVAELFEESVRRPGCRFFGNVEIGRDVDHEHLRAAYDAVVYAIGARVDRPLDIPGVDHSGSHSATAFVGWYNGHPDHSQTEWDLDCERAVVIGNGNVAADVTRLLSLGPAELEPTDVAPRALAALSESRVREVVVLGRRGPAQAAFTNAELAELGTLPGVDVHVDATEVELDELSSEWLEREGTYTARSNVATLREFARRPPTGASRRIVFRFNVSPCAVLGRDRVAGIEVCGNELHRTADGSLRSRATGRRETIDCGLVLRSIGYRGVPLPGVPFDERVWTIPHERGRVVDGDSHAPVSGVYAVGWIKRGPTGILGTNKRDAAETVAALFADADAGRLPPPADPGAVERLLDGPLVDWDGWQAIDRRERAAGAAAGRPRVKLDTVGELLGAVHDIQSGHTVR